MREGRSLSFESSSSSWGLRSIAAAEPRTLPGMTTFVVLLIEYLDCLKTRLEDL
jgi:hypothetical protein